MPDSFTQQVELGEGLQLLIGADIEELLAGVLADLDAVAAPLKLLAERAHVLAVGVENKNRRMVLLIGLALVNYVQAARAIDCHVVRGLPGKAVGELRPVVLHFVAVLSRADDQGAVGLLGREYRGCQRQAGRSGRGGGKKLTTRNSTALGMRHDSTC